MCDFTLQDREKIDAILLRVKDINGTIKRHEDQLYGDGKHQRGNTATLEELHDFMVEIKASTRTIFVFLGLIGITNIALIFEHLIPGM